MYVLTRQGCNGAFICKCFDSQDRALCNLGDNGNLCAVLRNETLEPNLANNYVTCLAPGQSRGN
jgi:hypothetical protein